MGNGVADAVEVLQGELHSGLCSHGRKVQSRIGRTAESHVYGNGVEEGLAGEDVPGLQPFCYRLHRLSPRFPGQSQPGAVDRRDRAVAR